MQSRWRLLITFVRSFLRANISRSSICRKFSLVGLLCALCLVYYYYHITTNIQKIPARNTNYLVAISSLQSFTEISRQYSKHYPTESSKNLLNSRTPSTIRSGVAIPLSGTAKTSQSGRYEYTQTLSQHKGVEIEGSPAVLNPVLKPHSKPTKKSQYGRGGSPRVLLLCGTDSYKQSLQVRIFLESHRVEFVHTSIAKGRFLVSERKNGSTESFGKIDLERLSLIIIVADIAQYHYAQPLLHYCRVKNVSLIWVALPPIGNLFKLSVQAVPNLDRVSLDSASIIHVTLSKSYPFFYARPGASTVNVPVNMQWTTFTVKSDDTHVTGWGLNSYLTHDAEHSNHKTNRSGSPAQNNPANVEIHQNYRTLLQIASVTDHEQESVMYSSAPGVIEDFGKFDGVRKIFVGTPLKFWLTRLILLDAVHVLCDDVTLVRGGRERLVMVDIDDVFVAPDGRKMSREDVQVLLEKQTELRHIVPGFTFNLGFVGGYYDKGLDSEILGSQDLVRHADRLWWFDHMFRHHQPHQMNSTALNQSMTRNKNFSLEHGIPASVQHYAVSPHHSGVYPVHIPLYDAWKEIWNVSVTTTEEYPHLRPDHRRRGFIHRGIRVLPRQTCRLFTHTFLISHFTGGSRELLSIAQGGEVFMTLLRNPISIFMTHTPNYCCDRLALTLFSELFHFTAKWTQLQMRTSSPEEMADKYFHLFPEDKMPLWTSPCDDKRHRAIWSANKTCSRLPSLLILGPQKSGTTALYTFLRLHPLVLSNKETEHHFEEIQFFNDEALYLRGIDWYMDQFPYPSSPLTNISSPSSASFPPSSSAPSSSPPSSSPPPSLPPSSLPPSLPPPSLPPSNLPPSDPPPSSASPLLFEKSATYLTHPLAPSRAHSLLPAARLIVLLADPAKRAYSWYQHQRAHSDPAALQHTFAEVLNASSPSSSTLPILTTLSHHCLAPAHYHQHITQWLSYYDPEQLLLLDGDDLVERPADVMDTVQEFLNLSPLNYHNMLQYDSRKGFYCVAEKTGRKKCLGKSKGRSYPPMDAEDHQWLANYYTPHNTRLRHLLSELGRTPPRWLVNSAIV